jgi:hypothetical protein
MMNIHDLQRIRVELSKQVEPPLVPSLVVDESFIVPTPDPDESQNEYVTRCMGVIGGEDKPQDQLLAICISTYENK